MLIDKPTKIRIVKEHLNDGITLKELKEILSSAKLVDYETSLTLFQFESSNRILKEANDFLINS